MNQSASHDNRAITLGGILISFGIIFGDIGTSPLYVMKAIVGDRVISEALVLGGLSCVFWTLTLQTTLKYVAFTLEADNHGEGGVFALYALVRRMRRWLIYPAMLGGSALLADGMITPPISVASAIEGLRIMYPHISTIPIIIAILAGLFFVQSLGTHTVGRSFGPIMVVWFSMLLVFGGAAILKMPAVLLALNPLYALDLLLNYPNGFWLLGAVFLCTTGAEALYSDLGHCGKGNIRVSWAAVKICLIANYAGQSAWLLMNKGELLNDRNPFFLLMPHWFLPAGIIISTLATIIASQALISGSFTLVNEAMRLGMFPKFKVVYPTELKGQLYVPFLNLLLFIGCIGVVLFFKESSNMEAAYGLAITLTMLMTTVLLSFFLTLRGVPPLVVGLFLILYLSIEGAFFVANLEKFHHGGWVTFIIAGLISFCMWMWHKGAQLKRQYTEYTSLQPALEPLRNLACDNSVARSATHLVYMTGAHSVQQIERKVLYSIFQKQPKRADVYWFIHVEVRDEPYGMDYKVTVLVPERVFRIDFMLGFRIEPRINLLFRSVIEDLSENGEIDILSPYRSLREAGIYADFKFIVLKNCLSYENDLPRFDRFVMHGYELLKHLSLTVEKSFGLDTSSVTVESVPLVIRPMTGLVLRRV